MTKRAVGWLVVSSGQTRPLSFDPVGKMLYIPSPFGDYRSWMFRSRSAAAYAIIHSWEQRQRDCVTYGWPLRDTTDDFYPGNLQVFSVIGEVRR